MSNNRNTAKTWFERLDKPSQEQFAQLLDYIFFKDETIPVAAIDGLTQLLANIPSDGRLKAVEPIVGSNVNTLLVPAYNVVTSMVIFSPNNAVVNIGTTPNGTDYYEGLSIENGRGFCRYDMPVVADTTFYFTGLPANTVIKIFKQ
jgi:hypothetical protein